MKNIIIVCLLLCVATGLNAQTVFGTWKTIDDNTGVEKSHVLIYEEDGKVYGKITKLLDPNTPENPTCENCEGAKKDAPILGLTFINGLEKDDDEYNGGTILDPENGKEYKCYIKLEGPDKLKVRGYIGFAALGRTQYWIRVK